MRLAGLVGKTGITPNGLTVLGLVATLGVAGVLALGHFQVGALLVILTALFDSLDGALARLTNRVTPFGAFLDSSLDRFSEGALYFGLLYAFTQRGATWEILLTYLALLGSLLVSYTRARAEGIRVECQVGFFTRFERFVVLCLGLLFPAYLVVALAILALFSTLTAVQRILHVRAVTSR